MKRRQFLATVARAGLLGGVVADPLLLTAAEQSETVRGRVKGGEAPLSEVLVSDGCRLVRTRLDGTYQLQTGPDSGPFVFVTTPRGYWAEVFYEPIGPVVRTGRADFRLKPVNQPDRFDFVFMADMHLGEQGVSQRKLRASLAEINRSRPAFILAQGDICLQSGVGQQYVDCLALAEMPVRNGAGNHEMMLAQESPRGAFHRLFGPTYYSFDWGPAHFIVLDGNKPIPGQEGWKAVHGAVEGNELAWLEADLAAQPDGKPIIVGVHIPIVSTYPERRRHSPKDAPYWEVTNDRVLTDLFSRHGVRLVLQGHMHENERATVGGVEYVASISISGSWWKGGAGMERGVDGTPRGYRIVSVNGSEVSHRYQSSGESRVDRQGEFVGLTAGISAAKGTQFVFNCYDAPNGSTAEARIQSGPWRPMPVFGAPSQTTPDLAMPHHFRLVADTTGLKPGPHGIQARVTWPDGTVIVERDTFVVENTGRGGA